jgi:indolepyruvate ferredoxin oxidoreductase, beta subunit
MNNKVTNVIIVGVGGQGIILASEILAEAVMLAGHDIRKSDVHGMAQRGGSVSSHVRFGENVKSPLIETGTGDYMLAFEKVEGLRMSDMLKEGASIILNNLEIVPTTVSTGSVSYPNDVVSRLKEFGFNVIVVEAQELAIKAGTPKTANVVLLAALASHLDIEKNIWVDVIKHRVPQKFLDINLKAFELGYESSKK